MSDNVSYLLLFFSYLITLYVFSLYIDNRIN